jgi:predicted phage terminase large subunit-like protein
MVMKRTVWKNQTLRIPLFRKFTPEYIDQLRLEKGGYEFSGQYMNEPVDDETADFQRDWINRFDLMDLDKIPHQYFITVDPALTKSEDSDYTGIVINAVTADNKWYIVKAYRARFNPTELVDELFSLKRMYGHRLKSFAVEKTAHMTALQPSIQAMERRLKKNLEIMDVTTLGRHKEDRIRALVPKLERNEIFFSEYCGDLIEELLAFPRSEHDDVLDALAYQLDVANPYGIPRLGETREMLQRPIKPRVQNNV